MKDYHRELGLFLGVLTPGALKSTDRIDWFLLLNTTSGFCVNDANKNSFAVLVSGKSK